MKKLFALLVAVAFMASASAQEMDFQIRGGEDVGISKAADNGYSFDFTAGYYLGRQFRLGAGLGVDHFSLVRSEISNTKITEGITYVPLYADIKVDISDQWFVTPYLNAEIGGVLNSKHDLDNSVGSIKLNPMFKIGLGLDFDVMTTGKFFIQCDYKYLGASRTNLLTDIDSSPSFLGISVGYIWTIGFGRGPHYMGSNQHGGARPSGNNRGGSRPSGSRGGKR